MGHRSSAQIGESAVARVDQALGFGRVLAHDPADPQAAGALSETTDARQVGAYSRRSLEQMAVLDYVIGNTDRGPSSWRTARDGTPVAVAHAGCFADRPVTTATRSDFVDRVLGVPLSDEIVAAVRAVDPTRLWIELLSIGLGSTAAAAALARLAEVAGRGMITGQAWPAILPVARNGD